MALMSLVYMSYATSPTLVLWSVVFLSYVTSLTRSYATSLTQVLHH